MSGETEGQQEGGTKGLAPEVDIPPNGESSACTETPPELTSFSTVRPGVRKRKRVDNTVIARPRRLATSNEQEGAACRLAEGNHLEGGAAMELGQVTVSSDREVHPRSGVG